MAFLASISPFGWFVIAIAVLALVTLPRLWRGAGRSNLPERRMHPGEDPPIYRGPEDV